MSVPSLSRTAQVTYQDLLRLHQEEQAAEVIGSIEERPRNGRIYLCENQIWKWRQNRGTAMVEFLTPAFGEEVVKPLPALGVSAQGLNYLNYLIAEPIPAIALYRSGVLVQIPRPERFAIHKLIVADRRKGGPDHAKSRKDRAQAAFLIEVLAQDRPDDLREALEDAASRGPRWRQRIDASLNLMPETRDILNGL